MGQGGTLGVNVWLSMLVATVALGGCFYEPPPRPVPPFEMEIVAFTADPYNATLELRMVSQAPTDVTNIGFHALLRAMQLDSTGYAAVGEYTPEVWLSVPPALLRGGGDARARLNFSFLHSQPFNLPNLSDGYHFGASVDVQYVDDQGAWHSWMFALPCTDARGVEVAAGCEYVRHPHSEGFAPFPT